MRGREGGGGGGGGNIFASTIPAQSGQELVLIYVKFLTSVKTVVSVAKHKIEILETFPT